MVSKEIRESQVIQKVRGQDHQDQREIQDCQVTWARKAKEDHLAHLDVRGLLDQRDFLGAPDPLATQGNLVLVVIWGPKELKASLAFQEQKALQVLQDCQEILDQWVREVIKDLMEFLVQPEKKEKQACWEHLQVQEGNLVLKEPKETGERQACLASLAGKGQWEMLGLQGPLA